MNLADLSIEHLERFGEYEALWFEERWYTNREMIERSAKIAHAMTDLGIKRGDRVATVLGNCPEVLNTFHAAFRIGAWCMPVLFTLTPEEMGFVFEDAKPSIVVCEKLFLPKVMEAKAKVPSIKAVVTVDGPADGTIDMNDWLEMEYRDFPPVQCEPDDIALLMYTSGTTGVPKGVMLSHENLRFTGIASAQGQGVEEGDVGLSVLPLNHSYGIITNIASTQFANKGVLLRWFNAEDTLKLIDRWRCNVCAVVPTMMVLLLIHEGADKYDTSSMRTWVSAAAPLTAEMKRRFEEKFGGQVLEGYGLTECSPTVAVNRADTSYKPGSVGLPLEGVEVSIQDPAGKMLPPGDSGEICVRGPNVMQGYYNRPEATAETIRDGWLHTGDVGHLDEDGYLYITERMKDMIIRGGENIYPKDIEEVLVQHPHVLETAVIGMPDEVYGEVPMAVVVARPGTDPNDQELLDFCRERLGKFQVPVRIDFMQALPKSPIGKILKKDLRKQLFK